MAIGNVHRNFGEDRTCSSEDTIADRQTQKHTHRHAQYNTPLPYRLARGVVVSGVRQ